MRLVRSRGEGAVGGRNTEGRWGLGRCLMEVKERRLYILMGGRDGWSMEQIALVGSTARHVQ